MFGKLLILLIYLFYYFNFYVVCRISNERRCADPKCSVPISIGRTLLQYNADDDRLLSFPRNVQVKIFSKEAGDNPTLWEAEIGGRRGYVPKDFIREDKPLVSPSDIKFTLPTEKIDKSSHVTENITEKTKGVLLDLEKTPELPVANSKGFFNMFEGVSADSVPPNSPDIKPQTTEKFQIIEGTTIYDDDNKINESLESNPTLESGVNETPKDNDGSLQENEALQENLNEKNSKKQEQLKVETVNNIGINKEGSSESIVETSETAQGASETNENDNVDEAPESTSSSILGDIGKTFSNMFSSGSGEIENEVIEVEEDDEYYEDENGSADNSDEVETGSVNNLNGNENANESLENNEETNYTTSSNEIDTSPSDSELSDSLKQLSNLSEEKSGSGFESEHVSETSNISEGTLNKYSNSETVKEGEAIETEVKMNKQAELTVEENMETQLNNISNVLDVNVTEEKEDSSSNAFPNNLAHSPIDIISQTANTVKTEEADLSNDLTNKNISDENITMPTNLSNDIDVAIASSGEEVSETHIPQVENPELTNQNMNKIVDPTSSTINVNLNVESIHQKLPSNDDLSDLKDISNDVNDNIVVKPVVEEPIVEEAIVEEPVFKEPLVEEPVVKESVVKESVVEEPVVEEPVVEEPVVEEPVVEEAVVKESVVKEPAMHSEQHLPPQIGKAQIPFYNSHKIENVSSESSSVSENTQEPDNQASSESKSPLLLPPNDSKDSTDIPTVPSVDFEINSSDTETIIDSNGNSLLELPKEKESHESPALPDLIEEILMAEEEINKAKSQQTSQQSKEHDRHSYDKDANSDYVVKEAHEDSGGLFSWMNPIFDIFTSQSKLVETSSTSSNDEIVDVLKSDILDPSRIEIITGESSCPLERLEEGDCESLKDVPVSKDTSWEHSLPSTDMLATLDLLHKIPLETTMWLIITAVAVLIFSLGHYYIEAHRRDGPLVAVINKFEKEVLLLKQEKSILQDRLQTVERQLNDWNTSSSENDALIVELRQELDETKVAKQDLEEQVAVLEREVESVMENGLEMHRLLEESLSSQDGSQVLLSTVETLREKLDRQEEEIATLSHSLSRKNVEVEDLEKRLSESEEKVNTLTRDKQEEALQLKDTHRQLMAQLEEVMETKALDETRISAELSKLRLTIEELQKTLAEKDAELEEVKEVVKQLRSTDSNDKMDALFDVVSVRAQLRTAANERDDFRERFHEEEGARKLLEGHMKKITQEVAELKNNYETAEKDKIEALTKLQVLSNYFKEKESQLQKELGLQESMWLQKQSDDHSIYEQMRSLREENEKYKLQNESLKKEIVEQESSFKIQIANVEQKSHENWVASRQAERRLKEVQQEAAQLRNRLTMEKHSANYSMEEGKPISESNGDPSSPPPSMMFPPTSSPPFMMYPMPPPGDFVPPPPLMGSPYPSDSRPPPLGRISSPPLDHRFSPPPPLPYPPFDYPPYGHHSPSPPPPIPSHSHHRNVHKPQPRELSREQKEHSMSNYSPEGDSTVRKNKR